MGVASHADAGVRPDVVAGGVAAPHREPIPGTLLPIDRRHDVSQWEGSLAVVLRPPGGLPKDQAFHRLGVGDRRAPSP